MVFKKTFLQPGNIIVKNEESLLCVVLSYGVAVSLFDRIKMQGGLCYYLFPHAKTKIHTLPLFAGPSLNMLLNLFLESGSVIEDIEAHIFGGAISEFSKEKMVMIAKENIKIARHFLEKKKVLVRSVDCGGSIGRKVFFNSKTGEAIVFKVNTLRKQDWSLEYVLEKKD